MHNKFMKFFAVVLVALFVSSCTVRSYVQDKSRVDQEMKGNAGCLQGDCPSVDRSNLKKTRATYVLEIQTGKRKSSVAPKEYVAESYAEETAAPKGAAPIVIHEVEETVAVEVVEPEEGILSEYTIEKGDTLQKISKKFYDTYRRWYEILEVNKDVITNPDRLKTGTVIKIPQAQLGKEENLK